MGSMFSGSGARVVVEEVTFGMLTPELGRLMDEKFGFPRSMVKSVVKLEVKPGEVIPDWKLEEKVDEKVDLKGAGAGAGAFGGGFGRFADKFDRFTDKSSLDMFVVQPGRI